MKYGSHTDARTFGRSYAHSVCEVDGPATYLNIASRHEHIQNRRSMGIHRNPNLWQSLPAYSKLIGQYATEASSDFYVRDQP
jgi:carbonic anhydrase